MACTTDPTLEPTIGLAGVGSIGIAGHLRHSGAASIGKRLAWRLQYGRGHSAEHSAGGYAIK
ncbi:MAG: hypothetical protein ACOYKN_02555 [Pirellula sp.]